MSGGGSPETHFQHSFSMKRRAFLTTASLVACVGFSGCTSMLFKDGEYRETIDRFLVTDDGKKLVVLGKQYHYILDMPAHLDAVLAAPYRKSVTASLYHFVAEGDKIHGEFGLHIRGARKRMTADDYQRALADGFTEHYTDLVLEGSVSGTRYTTEGFKLGQGSSAFNEPHEIDVTDVITPAGTAVRLLVTPVTLAADGVLMIGAIVLSPVIVPLVVGGVAGGIGP